MKKSYIHFCNIFTFYFTILWKRLWW